MMFLKRMRDASFFCVIGEWVAMFFLRDFCRGFYSAIFALRPGYCIFSTLPLDVENTVTRTQSLKVMVFCVLERNRKKRTKRVKK